MCRSPRRAVIAALAVTAMFVFLIPSSGGAAEVLDLPFWSGSVKVPVPTRLETYCFNDITHIASCSGTSCQELQTYNCHPYGCTKDGTACAPACTSSADCAGGSVCNTTTGQCSLAFAICSDAWAIKMPNGQVQSCAPYKCIAGKCQQQCTAAGDCAPGYACKKSLTTKRYYCAKAG